MPFWHRAAIAAAVFLIAAIVARIVDARMRRKKLPPESITRYRVLRRSVQTAIAFVGLLSALLVIPQVRAIAGGILASSAVLGLIVGFASQRTLGNFVAGILIAFTQPLRLGDRVEVDGTIGTVEDIGLTYTFIRTDAGVRLVIPNEKLASDTILNSTIRNPHKVAEVAVQVPLTTDLSSIVEQLRPLADDLLVQSIEGNATVVLRAGAPDEAAAERLESDLRLRAHERLRANGLYT